MRQLALVLIATVALAGCGKNPNEAANVLFVEAAKLISQAQAKEDADYEAAIADYEKALELIQKITDKYPEADLAVKLVSNETLFTGETLAEIKARMVQLVNMAEKRRRAAAQAKAEELQRKAVAKAAAEAQAKAFENSLGMKFVPVAGTDVPFSIWETRVKDYAAYAAANSGVDAEWKNPTALGASLSQTDTHPVVKVSWNHAQAFCEWLTKKELAEGKIKAGQKYRLPTDAEWSVAVGLGRETGSTPAEKSRGIEGVYLWGKEWPPPVGAGNYFKSLNVDNYEYTSPAGSFAANKLGLHDLGGNVWEWCEDWYDPAAKEIRVLRGVSWIGRDPGILLSSTRSLYTPAGRGFIFGFRCVLVGGSGG